MKTFWFITAINYDFVNHPKTRCWGFLDNFADVEYAVLHNQNDIHELDYNFAVIEEHYMSSFALGTGKLFWYKWNEEKSQYEKTEAPENFKYTVHWGIG